MVAFQSANLADPSLITILVGCAAGASFMVRFLIALLLDGRRVRAVRVFPVAALRRLEPTQLINTAAPRLVRSRPRRFA